MDTTDTTPKIILDWARTRKITLDGNRTEREQNVWAEWDEGRRGEDRHVYLGQWVATNCPRCGQWDRYEQTLIVPDGFDDNNWQHGCGEWWHPVWLSVEIPNELTDDDADVVATKLDTALAELTGAVDELREKIRDQTRRALEEQLRDFLALPLDEREDEANGCETEPGVYRDGDWLAWDYDPAGIIEEGITVHTRDLPVAVSEAAVLLGVTAESASRTLRRWGVEPVGRAPGRGGESLFDRKQVERAIENRPGQGRRTDLPGPAGPE